MPGLCWGFSGTLRTGRASTGWPGSRAIPRDYRVRSPLGSPEGGKVSERVAELQRFHDTMSFGSRDERIRRQEEAAGLYRALGPHEARELATFAIGAPAPGGDRYRWHEEI